MTDEAMPMDPADFRVELDAAVIRHLVERDPYRRRAEMKALQQEPTLKLLARNGLRLQGR